MVQYSPTVQEKIDRIDELQAQIEAMRPIKPEYMARIFQKYRLEWNYNSNSIEGNSLNYGETVAFIMEGLTAKGKPLKDHLDIKGHNEAIDFLLDMQKKDSELMERDIRSLHEMILVEPYQSKAQTADGQATIKTIRLGEYKSSPNHVITRTGETHFYASPEETPALMQELMAWYRENLHTMHPLVLSTFFHHRFVNIHPFDDGNGRMSRLLSNLILMQAKLPPVVVRQDAKSEYYGVLSQADAGVTEPLLEYFADLLIRSLETYLKGARGEDISEPDDLDKQIALFVSGFDEELLTREEMTRGGISKTFDDSILPLLSKIDAYIKKLQVLFHSYSVKSRKEELAGKGFDYETVYFSGIDKLFSFDNGIKKIFIDDFFAPEFSTIRVLKISYELSDFKANPTMPGFEADISIAFNNFDYTIETSIDEEKIIRYYPKQLSKADVDAISVKVVQHLMSLITTATK